MCHQLPDPEFIEFSRGVDLLVHEEAASLFSQATPKVAAFTHVVAYGVERRDILERTKAGCSGGR